MDGDNVAADFGNRFAADIRLPEALEEKLLCPFHYFGVADPVALNHDQFWRNGKYDVAALENVYVMDHIRAKQRVDAILTALNHYEPNLNAVKGNRFLCHHKTCRLHGGDVQQGGDSFSRICLRNRRWTLPGIVGWP